MVAKSNKWYVVWRGRNRGIFSTWNACKAEVEGFEKALYKGFPTRELAEAAFRDDPGKYLNKELNAPKKIVCSNPLVGVPDPDSICVDAACKGNPGILEYRGVDTRSGAELFHVGPFPQGTVNIGEFLGIVHALAYLKKRHSSWPIYSDSRTAIAWLKAKNIKTKLEETPENKKLFELVERAVKWLHENSWDNPVRKWETEYWGEIPADFGRK
ncbi:MAG: ribonuclease H family protein [Bacteroidota bacterium]|nr:ribonuclease H family protein [Bacteroidota bacterium]